ncbi:MAG: hypothetical protein IJ604_01970 [Prevotella sp.]|nr:hypothetical protein [Prevotella sp.]MBR1462133.1 hypothetical protein [Prevotella sp.]
MNTRRKRHIASWILLATIVPMLLLSSLHIHQTGSAAESMCAECVHHHCAGHLGQQAEVSHDCVLCQILCSHMLPADDAAPIIYNKVATDHPALWQQPVFTFPHFTIGLRAPPTVSL